MLYFVNKHRKTLMMSMMLTFMMVMMVAPSFAQSIDTEGLSNAAIEGVQTLFDFFVQFLPTAMVIIAVGAGFGLAFVFARRIVADFVRSLNS